MIELPWPNRVLSPNAREHHFTVARAKKKAKADAWALAREAVGRSRFAAPVSVVVTFCPPDNRARDLDNMIASFKAYQDGVAQAIGVDDSQWSVHYQRGPVRRPAAVLVDIDGVADVPFRGVIS